MMTYPRRFLLYSLLISITSLFLGACQATPSASLNPLQTPGISLYITGNNCPSLEANAGDQIAWTNQDQQVHQIRITTTDGIIVFDSGDLQQGDTASFILTQAGEYSYSCSKEEDAVGLINVQP